MRKPRFAAWRAEFRSTGQALLWLLGLLLIAGMYLAVNAKVARSGREVLILEQERAELQRENAQLTTALAEQTSVERMVSRAVGLGFRPATPRDVQYILVPGLDPKPDFVAPLPPSSRTGAASGLLPAFRETLVEWIVRWLESGDGR